MLLVCPDEGGEDAVLLVQQSLWPVVLQDDPALHHNHQVGIQDGVDAMLQQASRREATVSIGWSKIHSIDVFS